MAPYASVGAAAYRGYRGSGSGPPFRMTPVRPARNLGFGRGRRPPRRGGRVSRSMKSRGSKKRSKFLGKYAKASYTYVTETGFSQIDNTCCNIGHCDMPTQLVSYAMNAAFARALIEKVGNLPPVPNIAVPDLTTGDLVIVYYTTSWNTNTLSNYSHSVTAGESLAVIATGLNSSYNTARNALTDASQMHIKSLRYEVATGSKLQNLSINLSGCTIGFSAKSVMKVQNRTDESATSNEADTVDAVPLAVKIYSGNGTGTENRNAYQSTVGYEWVCSAITGIYNIAGGADEGFQEPPPKACLPQVRSVSSSKLMAGDIKTSTLTSTFKCKLSDLMVKLPKIATGTSFHLSKLGKFRFYSLEKVLEYENTKASRKDITLKCESSRTITCYLNWSSRQYVAPENDVN